MSATGVVWSRELRVTHDDVNFDGVLVGVLVMVAFLTRSAIFFSKFPKPPCHAP